MVGLTGGIGSGKSTVAELLDGAGRGRHRRRPDRAAGGRAGQAGARRARRAVRRRDPRGRRLARPARARREARSPTTRRASRTSRRSPIRRSARSSSRQVAAAPAGRRSSSTTCRCSSSRSAACEYDAVIVVEAPRELRLDRLEARGVARDDAERRMAPQATDEERRAVATWVVDNGGDLRRRSSARSTRSGPSSQRHAAAEEKHAATARTNPDHSCHGSSVPSPSARFRARHRSRARGRPARGDRGARRRASSAGDQFQTLLGITGLGEVVHDRRRHRRGATADARARAEQEPRRAARGRVPRALPEEPGRVLRLLLRLLPARGVPPVDRHVHREGLVDQRRDRPAAPLGHERARCPAAT